MQINAMQAGMGKLISNQREIVCSLSLSRSLPLFFFLSSNCNVSLSVPSTEQLTLSAINSNLVQLHIPSTPEGSLCSFMLPALEVRAERSHGMWLWCIRCAHIERGCSSPEEYRQEGPFMPLWKEQNLLRLWGWNCESYLYAKDPWVRNTHIFRHVPFHIFLFPPLASGPSRKVTFKL